MYEKTHKFSNEINRLCEKNENSLQNKVEPDLLTYIRNRQTAKQTHNPNKQKI